MVIQLFLVSGRFFSCFAVERYVRTIACILCNSSNLLALPDNTFAQDYCVYRCSETVYLLVHNS